MGENMIKSNHSFLSAMCYERDEPLVEASACPPGVQKAPIRFCRNDSCVGIEVKLRAEPANTKATCELARIPPRSLLLKLMLLDVIVILVGRIQKI
jgi:hypothetical protein